MMSILSIYINMINVSSHNIINYQSWQYYQWPITQIWLITNHGNIENIHTNLGINLHQYSESPIASTLMINSFVNTPSPVLIQLQQLYHPVSFLWRYPESTLPSPFVNISPNWSDVLIFTDIIFCLWVSSQKYMVLEHNNLYKE